MQLKTNNLKSIINKSFLALATVFTVTTQAQEVIKDAEAKPEVKEIKADGSAKKVDGVAAVIGDFIVLDSDIDKTIMQLKVQGASIEGVSRCQLFGKLLEDKLYAHSAIQDSITVNDLEITSYVNQQIKQFLSQTKGGMKELLEFYNQDNEKEFRAEMFEINKNNRLAAEMQKKIVDNVEITPEEVRQFFNKIPKNERPTFGTELKVAQIVVEPKVSQEEEQRVINRLKKYKKDIENGSSFRSKVVLYTDDKASIKNGGLYTLNRNRPQMVKEFRETAFSLQEGEISDPVKTDFGYHIILLEKIRGNEYDVRHLLLMPKISDSSTEEARQKLEDVRSKIINGDITFAEAAKEVSDEEKTKLQGGQLINPTTQDYNFELTKMDPELYSQIQEIKDGEISKVITQQDRSQKLKFKIITVTDRIDEHEADYARDYLKIKELALNQKRIKVIQDWQNKTIKETYIKISDSHKSCEFNSNWLKN